MAGGIPMKIDINKKFQRGGQLYCISNDEKEEDYFVLKKGDNVVTGLIGYYGNIFDKTDYRFDAIRPVGSFSDPLDRIAIGDAIAYLEERYKTP